MAIMRHEITDREEETAPVPSRDPWMHRTDGMRCMTCMWYVEKLTDNPKAPVRKGRCRRHAPTMSGYPVVYPDDWCGDHKLV